MSRKTAFNFYGTQTQALAVGQNVAFPSSGVKVGCSTDVVSNATGTMFTINRPGLYKVSVNADILGTVAGIVQLQLTKSVGANSQSVAVLGAEASQTVADGDTYTAAFETLIDVPASCCGGTNNSATLAVQLNTTATSITNSNINIVRV